MKNFKKFVALTLVAVTTLSLGSCGEEGEGSATEEVTKVTMLIPGELGDKSYFDSAERGIRNAEKKYDGKMDVSIQELGTNVADYEPAILDAIDTDADLIVTLSWNMQGAIEKIAPDYQDINFLIIDTPLNFEELELSNTNATVFLPSEGSYLAGAFAAMVSETGNIGFLGGFDDVGIHEFLVGYIEGAQSINPDINVLTSWVGSYSDAATAKTMALSQYGQGVDIGFNVAGGSGLGQIQAAAETDNWAIGVDSDQYAILVDDQPELAEHIPTSMIKGIDVAIEQVIDLYFNDEFPAGELNYLGIKEGGVYLVQNDLYNEVLSDEQKEKINELEDKIASGEIEVSNAFEMKPEAIQDLINSVKP